MLDTTWTEAGVRASLRVNSGDVLRVWRNGRLIKDIEASPAKQFDLILCEEYIRPLKEHLCSEIR